jgi:hypothetical protein
MRPSLSEDNEMGALLSRSPQKSNRKPEWCHALQLLAGCPRGATEEVLVLGHGVSHQTLAMLALAGLATVVTETLRVDGETSTIERLRITDAGRRAIGG